ncbi:hypothetical protein [Deinococcus seoulensis]|uniref:hypothetical protein n=1 Tax=Deinococcus seoulensis TaxID=1837379 RepID=UPI001664B17D|nr:hypothetical protein [Deinococcus seoulensis]
MTVDLRLLRREIRAQKATPARLNDLAAADVTLARLIARQYHTPVPVLETLASHADVFTRRNVAGHSRTPTATLIQLARERRFHVLKALASNRGTPGEVINKLARHHHHTVRAACLGHPQLSFNRYYQLAHDPHAGVQTAWLEHELTLIRWKSTPLPTPDELAAWLASPHISFRHVLARHLYLLLPEQQTATADALLTNDDPVIREHVILYASEAMQNLHSRDPSPWIRGVIAARTTDPDLVRSLLDDPDEHVRRAATRNPQHIAHPGAHP